MKFYKVPQPQASKDPHPMWLSFTWHLGCSRHCSEPPPQFKATDGPCSPPGLEAVITLTREEPSCAGEALPRAFPQAAGGKGRNAALLSQAALDALKTRVSRG